MQELKFWSITGAAGRVQAGIVGRSSCRVGCGVTSVGHVLGVAVRSPRLHGAVNGVHCGRLRIRRAAADENRGGGSRSGDALVFSEGYSGDALVPSSVSSRVVDGAQGPEPPPPSLQLLGSESSAVAAEKPDSGGRGRSVAGKRGGGGGRGRGTAEKGGGGGVGALSRHVPQPQSSWTTTPGVLCCGPARPGSPNPAPVLDRTLLGHRQGNEADSHRIL